MLSVFIINHTAPAINTRIPAFLPYFLHTFLPNMPRGNCIFMYTMVSLIVVDTHDLKYI